MIIIGTFTLRVRGVGGWVGVEGFGDLRSRVWGPEISGLGSGTLGTIG